MESGRIPQACTKTHKCLTATQEVVTGLVGPRCIALSPAIVWLLYQGEGRYNGVVRGTQEVALAEGTNRIEAFSDGIFASRLPC